MVGSLLVRIAGVMLGLLLALPFTNAFADNPTVVHVDQYPQCGGTTGLQNFPSQDTIKVTASYMSDGTIHYQDTDLGNLGQCGTAAPTPSSQPVTNMVTTCKGTMNQSDMESQLRGANYPGPWDVNSEIAAFNRAACPSTPVVQQPTSTPAPAPTSSFNTSQNQTVTNTNSNTATGGTSYISFTPSYTQPAAVYYPPATPTPTYTPTPAPTYTPTPQTKSTIYYQPTSSAPQVTGTYSSGAKQLPQTGVPDAAWGLTGLLPLGWTLRKFGSKTKEGIESAGAIWNERISKKTWLD